MFRLGFVVCAIILSMVMLFLAQESNDAVEHVGFVWSVGTRGSIDEEPDSTYFIFCRERVQLPSNEKCQVIWFSGGVDVGVGDYARVMGEQAHVTQRGFSELKRLSLAGEETEEDLSTMREYSDVLIAHQRIVSMAYGEPPGLRDRFEVLPYVRAGQATRVDDEPEP